MRAAFLGVPIDLLTVDETVASAVLAMQTKRRCQHVALNVAKFVKMQRDHELRRHVVESDIIGIDGMGIVYGARLLGVGVPERVAGIDLFERLMGVCSERGLRPYFLGAKPEILETAISKLRARFPQLSIAGSHHGYFGSQEDQEIVRNIRKSGADCLFIGLPTPRKERLLAQFKDDFGAAFVMGVGGSFDVVAGAVSRSPRWMQRIGTEWLFRAFQEPRRMFWRYLSTNCAFIFIVARALVARYLGQATIELIG